MGDGEGRGRVPGNNLSGTRSYSEETEKWEDHGNAETPDRNTFLCAFLQKAWGVTV